MIFLIFNFSFYHTFRSRPVLPLPLTQVSGRSRIALPQSGSYFPDKARDKLRMCQSMQSTGKLQLSPDTVYDFTSEDLQDLGEIGRGGFGTVNKMIHRISNTVMAVKVNNNKQILLNKI